MVRAPGLDAGQHLVLGDAQPLGDLGGGRGAPEGRREVLGGAVHLHPQLVQPARYVDGADVVAEVPLDLADDGRHREGRELHAAVGVEAVDRVDQPDRADLDDVLHRLVAAAEAGGRVPHEREVGLDEGAAHPVVLGGARLQVLELAEEHLGEGPGVGAAVGAAGGFLGVGEGAPGLGPEGGAGGSWGGA